MTIELRKLTWSNHFQVEKDTFLAEVLGQEGGDDLSAVQRADEFDCHDKDVSDAPSMLYSVIRELPQLIGKVFVHDGPKQPVHDGSEQQMKKRKII